MRRIFYFHKSNSGKIARSRLKLLLVSDQARCSPALIELIKDDIVGVLSRYADIDSTQMDVCLTKMESTGTKELVPALSAKIPLRQFTSERNEECY